MTSTERLFRLDGKVALVTGGYGGIGVALAVGLAEMGARVAIAGHDGKKCAAFADSLKSMGHDAISSPFDALSEEQTNGMADDVAAHFGRLDILVNTVGVNHEQKAGEVTADQFDHVFDVTVRGAMFQAQAVARHMIRQGMGGRIIHFGSVRSQLALRGRGYAAYCAAKGGLVTMSKQLAAEFAPHRINVNVVAPTFVRTEQAAPWLSDPVFYGALLDRIPLQRIAEPVDLVGAVIYLVSPASDFVTGQTLFVDGGLTATQ